MRFRAPAWAAQEVLQAPPCRRPLTDGTPAHLRDAKVGAALARDPQDLRLDVAGLDEELRVVEPELVAEVRRDAVVLSIRPARA